MRIDHVKGLYLQYTDVAQPVEVYDRVVYSFHQSTDRTCLVTRLDHVQRILQTGRYRVVGVEVEEAQHPVTEPVKKGRAHAESHRT